VKILEVMFAAVTDLDEGLRIETLFALKTEKYTYVICLVGTRRLTILPCAIKYSEV
jgi:aspartate 1-decarboxylase